MFKIRKMLQKLIDKLFSNPIVFSTVRGVLDNNFKGVKLCIQRELDTRGFTLDLGCGTGDFSVLFPSDKYLGIDVSKSYIDYAKKKYKNYSFLVGDATNMNFDMKFDNVLILGMLHHLRDDEIRTILSLLCKILKRKGVLLIIEDIPHFRAENLLGILVRKFDVGKFIRSHEEYGLLYKRYFNITKSYTTKSGIARYSVYVLKNEK